MTKQRIFLLKCSKCGKEFETATYTTVGLIAQQEVAPGVVTNQEVEVKMTPCPNCNYATEINPQAYIEGEYEYPSTSSNQKLRFIR